EEMDGQGASGSGKEVESASGAATSREQPRRAGRGSGPRGDTGHGGQPGQRDIVLHPDTGGGTGADQPGTSAGGGCLPVRCGADSGAQARAPAGFSRPAAISTDGGPARGCH